MFSEKLLPEYFYFVLMRFAVHPEDEKQIQNPKSLNSMLCS